MKKSIEIIFYLNDMLLELTGLVDKVDDFTVADALVKVTLRDAVSAVEIVGETWPLTMAPVAGVPGKYSAVLAAALALAVGQRVVADVTVDAGARGLARYQPTLIVRTRTFE